MPWQVMKPSAPRTRLEKIRVTAVVAAAGVAEWYGLICSCGVRALLLGGDEEQERRELSSFIARAVVGPADASPGDGSPDAGAAEACPASLIYFS